MAVVVGGVDGAVDAPYAATGSEQRAPYAATGSEQPGPFGFVYRFMRSSP